MTAKVLIVDDNPSIRYLLKASLSSFGFHTALAENGQVALEQLDLEKPDLVFLDLMMPVLDGWGVLDRLQGRIDLPPIVVISALDSQEDKERAMGLGVTAYVSKPADLGGLVDLVRSLTGETAPEPGGGGGGGMGPCQKAPGRDPPVLAASPRARELAPRRAQASAARNSSHSPSSPLSAAVPRGIREMSEPTTRSRTVRDTRI